MNPDITPAEEADPLDELKTKMSEVFDQLDMVLDEVTRIHILAIQNDQTEIAGLCERAMKDIPQKVPVIAQRDQAVAAVAQAKEENARLRTAADKAYHALRSHGMTGYAEELKAALSQQPNQTGEPPVPSSAEVCPTCGVKLNTYCADPFHGGPPDPIPSLASDPMVVECATTIHRENYSRTEMITAIARLLHAKTEEKEREIERLRQTLEEHAKGNVEFIAVPSGILAERDAQQQAEERLEQKEADRQYHMNQINRLAASVDALGETSEAVIQKAINQLADLAAAQADVKRLPEDVRSFIERVTLHLQKQAPNFEFFQEAYRLYSKYDVEGRSQKPNQASE